MDFHPYTAQTTKSWLLSSFDCYHSSFLSTISYNLLSYKFGIYFYHILIKYLGNPHSWDYYIYSILCSTVIVSLSQSDYLPRYYPSPYYRMSTGLHRFCGFSSIEVSLKGWQGVYHQTGIRN